MLLLLTLTPNSGLALNSAPHCFSSPSLRAVWGLPLELRRPPGKTTRLSGPGHRVPLLSHANTPLVDTAFIQTTQNVFKCVITFFQDQLSHFDFWTQFEHLDHAQAASPPAQQLRLRQKKKAPQNPQSTSLHYTLEKYPDGLEDWRRTCTWNFLFWSDHLSPFLHYWEPGFSSALWRPTVTSRQVLQERQSIKDHFKRFRVIQNQIKKHIPSYPSYRSSSKRNPRSASHVICIVPHPNRLGHDVFWEATPFWAVAAFLSFSNCHSIAMLKTLVHLSTAQLENQSYSSQKFHMICYVVYESEHEGLHIATMRSVPLGSANKKL